MKNNYIPRLLLITALAFMFAGCSQRENLEPTNPNEQITLKFNINNADDVSTKALLGTDENGKKFLNWENGDKIGTFSVGTFGEQTTSNNNAGTVVVSNGNYTLNVRTFNAGNVTNIYSYYPYSSAAGKDKTSAIVTIPGSQFMTAEGFDADAMPMAGTPIEVNLETAANTDKPCGTINFSNLGSIINFKVYSSEATNETLTSVKYVSTSGNLAGNYTINLTSIDSADDNSLVLGGDGTYSEITTVYQGEPAIGTGKSNAIDVYMVVAPGTYSGSKVIVTTSAKTYTLTSTQDKIYYRSHVKPMYVDIAQGSQSELPQEEIWERVTSISDFTAGTYYILNWDETKYLPNDEAGSAPSAKDFNGTVANDMKWEATVSGNGLIFKNPTSELYLWGQDGTNNGVRVKKTAPATASKNVWLFKSDSSFGVIASVGENRYLATYNNNGNQQDWRNYQYSSLGDGTNKNNNGQVVASVNNFPAVFYKLQEGNVQQKETPELAFNNPTTTVNVGETVTNDATISPSNLAITYSSSDEDVATVTDAGVVTGVTAGTATITAAFAGDDEYNAVSTSYEITVVDPNANDGTEEKPYTASEAATLALEGNTSTVYVKGYISSIVEPYSSYGNTSFNISEDGSTNNPQFEIFRVSATTTTDYMVGDYVVFQGTLKNYNGTAEFDTGSTKINQVKAPRFNPDGGNFSSTTLSVSLSADSGAEIRYSLGSTLPTATTGAVYSSAISVSETTTINAIAIKEGITTCVVSKTFTKIAGAEVQFAVSDFSGLGTSNTGSELSVTKSGITFACDKGYGTTQLRCYKGSTITISAGSGMTITSISFTFSGSYTGGLDSTYTNLSATSWTSGELASQARLTAISVTYK